MADGFDDDVDLPDPRRRRDLAEFGRWVLVVIAAGGVIGAELRYGVGVLLPSGSRSFPWATVLVNVTGGFGIGVLMTVLGRSARPHPLLRPFLGIGVLGGFTTFSTYSTDTFRLIDAGRPELAFGYAALTLFAALAGTVAGIAVGSVVTGRAPEPVTRFADGPVEQLVEKPAAGSGSGSSSEPGRC